MQNKGGLGWVRKSKELTHLVMGTTLYSNYSSILTIYYPCYVL